MERVRSLAGGSVPLPWVWIAGTVLVGVVAWCVQLQAEVTAIVTSGSPAATAALKEVGQLQTRIGILEAIPTQVAINGNRLTKLETEMDVLQRERMAPR